MDYNLKLNINGVETAIASIEDLESALKATTSEMKTLQVGSDAFNAAAKNAQKLQSELDSINEKTKNIDTKEAAKSFAKLGETVTGAFAVATNAIALFGSESQDVAKAQAQAQQAIAIVLGARAIAEGVVEGAAAARLLVDKISIVTTGVLTGLFGELAVAEGAAATGQLALNAAMKAAPYAVIIAAIVALVSLMGDSANAAKEAQAATAALSKSVSELNTSYSELISMQSSIFDSLDKYIELTGKLTDEQENWLYTLGQGAGLNADQVKAYADQGIEVLKLVTNLETLKSQQTSLEGNASKTLASLNELVAGNKEFTGQFTSEVEDYVVELERQNVINGELDETDKARLETAKLYLTIKQEESKVSDKILLTELQQQNAAADKLKKEADAAKKRAEDEKKRQDDIKAILKKTADETLTIEQEKNFKLREIANEYTKNLEVKEKETLAIEFGRANAKIDNAKLKAAEELRVKLASDEQIKASDDEFEKQRTSLFEQALAEKLLVEKKYSDQRKEIADILDKELAYGDFNLSDRKKKLALEDQSFYEQMRIKDLEVQLNMGQMTVANTKATIEAIRLEKENAAITERDLRLEEIDTQQAADMDRLKKQLEEGRIIQEEFDATKKGIEDQAREEKVQAELDAITTIETANAEATQRNIDLKRQEMDDMFAITNQGLQSIQALSDIYFAIKSANTKKDSKEAEENAKKQFKINKALTLVGIVLDTAKAAITSLSQSPLAIGPVPSPVGIASFAAVVLTGIASFAKAASVQYQSGAAPSAPSSPSLSGGGGGDSGGSTIIQAASTGGFTSFGSGLVGTPGGGTSTGGGNTGGGPDSQRVYVVESDITNTQRRVAVAESNATF